MFHCLLDLQVLLVGSLTIDPSKDEQQIGGPFRTVYVNSYSVLPFPLLKLVMLIFPSVGVWFTLVGTLIVIDTGCCWTVANSVKYGFKCSFRLARLPNFAQQDYNRG